MMKSSNTFPNEYLDNDYIVFHGNQYYPLKSWGGSVLLDRGGTLFEWNNLLGKYIQVTNKETILITENPVAFCIYGGGLAIPGAKKNNQAISVNFSPNELVVDGSILWSIDDITKIRISRNPFFGYEGYTDIHSHESYIRIMCNQWQLNHFENVANHIHFVEELCDNPIKVEIL